MHAEIVAAHEGQLAEVQELAAGWLRQRASIESSEETVAAAAANEEDDVQIIAWEGLEDDNKVRPHQDSVVP